MPYIKPPIEDIFDLTTDDCEVLIDALIAVAEQKVVRQMMGSIAREKLVKALMTAGVRFESDENKASKIVFTRSCDNNKSDYENRD